MQVGESVPNEAHVVLTQHGADVAPPALSCAGALVGLHVRRKLAD
jgi:hypothetical protein